MSYARLARRCARICGHPASLFAAAAFILIWGITGPLFGWSDTWQLVANTATSIITFLMVFLIQNSQDHDTAAIQLKLDELIRATRGAHNALLDLEELDEEAIRAFRARYIHLACAAREGQQQGLSDTDSPEA
ncbi:low affinity iron permease family protein [Pseudogemmobacter faecipullorum]|uniref:Low affinity iron permease family protein n=1 Tax=Pseudogemmobacter faecipullorum TaxID=2755041 RepID=A0ABS8CHW2_9RHOB|nr:low affinity iron permease family protein [Pseudogemmobacter faecipullorum]MCB5408974.1 low affinity iron permease family protein [Pseudogemmobacter faecipullorum]